PGGAEPVGGLAGDGVREPGPQGGDPRNAETLFGLRQRAAEHHVLALAGIQARHAPHRLGNDRRRHLIGPRVLQRTAWRFADGSTHGGDDNSFSHDTTSQFDCANRANMGNTGNGRTLCFPSNGSRLSSPCPPRSLCSPFSFSRVSLSAECVSSVLAFSAAPPG